jgi:hypothetical protein
MADVLEAGQRLLHPGRGESVVVATGERADAPVFRVVTTVDAPDRGAISTVDKCMEITPAPCDLDCGTRSRPPGPER